VGLLGFGRVGGRVYSSILAQGSAGEVIAFNIEVLQRINSRLKSKEMWSKGGGWKDSIGFAFSLKCESLSER
jgi:homoserine dehydrogenase